LREARFDLGSGDAFADGMRTSTKNNVRAALSDWDWSAIAAGVVIALAAQVLLLWLGDAIVLSVGDRRPAGGFAVWVVLVQLGSLFLGAGFAAFVAKTMTRASGAAIGAFTWALALVLGTSLASRPLESWRPEDAAAAAWTTFLGALLGLGAAMVGGVVGSTRARAQAGGASTGVLVTEEHIVTVTPPGTTISP
jgi:hypothetical protein